MFRNALLSTILLMGLPGFSQELKISEHIQRLCGTTDRSQELLPIKHGLAVSFGQASRSALLVQNSSANGTDTEQIGTLLSSALRKQVLASQDCRSALTAMKQIFDQVNQSESSLQKLARERFLLSDEQLRSRGTQSVSFTSDRVNDCIHEDLTNPSKMNSQLAQEIETSHQFMASQISSSFFLEMSGSNYDGDEPRYSRELRSATCAELPDLMRRGKKRALEINAAMISFFTKLEKAQRP